MIYIPFYYSKKTKQKKINQTAVKILEFGLTTKKGTH